MNLPRTAAIILMAFPGAISVQAERHVLALDPQASKVTFTLKATGHMVEGGLALKSGRITFDPATGAASGEIAIDLASAQTGNKGRDEKMHDEVLETKKHPVAVFRAEKLRGTVPTSGTGQATLDGTLSLHGSEHKVSLPAKLEIQGSRVKAVTRFEIPYVEWGLNDPSVVMLRVAKVVTVTVRAEGTLEAGAD